MKIHRCRVGRWVTIAGSLALAILLTVAPRTVAADLAGLWESQVIHGPATQGRLLIREINGRFVAEIGGNRTVVQRDESHMAFSLPDGSRFDGHITADADIKGHWLQPPSKLDGNVFATPVRLREVPGGWQGTVVPQPDTTTFFLLLAEADGELTAELINPDRNLGVFQELTTVARNGNDVTLMGRFRGRGEEQPTLRGTYYPDEDILAVRYPGRGGGYDFRRVTAGNARGFLARRPGGELTLQRPVSLGDGWETATPVDVGIDTQRIVEMITTHILPEPKSTHNLSVHALLIARHGKLVIEEYFHGCHRDLPHDSRSASKSVTSILAAATMRAGTDLAWDTPVYRALGRDSIVAKEPERNGITLRHLVNMNSGLDCDDRNPESAANEDYLWDHYDELDFYEHALGVDIVHVPGEVAAYCSAGANLAGGVIEAMAGESLLSLIDRSVARPLDITRYSVPVPPDGHPFMGGGIRWLARDFLKFPQLLLDGGSWNGRRVINEEEAKRMLTPAVKIDGGRDYGYLWWTEDYEFKGRTVRAHFMGGNGGQIAMLVPEFDLGIVFNAGNYSDRVSFQIQNELIPNYILPAIID
jgi:CubicO group peptidase (beta-lactamase class C family)